MAFAREYMASPTWARARLVVHGVACASHISERGFGKRARSAGRQ